MARIGYARVSTVDQDLEGQLARLRTEGCAIIRSEKVSGGSREGRTELATVLEFLRPGDELVVTRLDRLGRDTRDVLNVVHEAEQRGASVTVLDPHVSTRGDGARRPDRPWNGGSDGAAVHQGAAARRNCPGQSRRGLRWGQAPPRPRPDPRLSSRGERIGGDRYRTRMLPNAGSPGAKVIRGNPRRPLRATLAQGTTFAWVSVPILGVVDQGPSAAAAAGHSNKEGRSRPPLMILDRTGPALDLLSLPWAANDAFQGVGFSA